MRDDLSRFTLLSEDVPVLRAIFHLTHGHPFFWPQFVPKCSIVESEIFAVFCSVTCLG